MSCIGYWGSRSRPFSDSNPPPYGYVRSGAELAGDAQEFAWGLVCCRTLCAMLSRSRLNILHDCKCPAGGGQREPFTGVYGRRRQPVNVGVELGVGVRRQVVRQAKQQEPSVAVAVNGDVPQLAVRRRIADVSMPGTGRNIVSPTAAGTYPEVCVCALR